MDINQFICQEVRNQGHDLNTEDGQQRVSWMHEAWAYAQENCERPPTIEDMLEVARLIERVKNVFGLRRCEVRVGGRRCPPAVAVRFLVNLLWNVMHELEPIRFYEQFQYIHPFEDGNGRTGKVLLHWLNGKLDDPEMPPDLFGGGVP